MADDRRFEFYAVTALGLEHVARDELQRLGIEGVAEPGGVTWMGGWNDLYRANLHLRTVSRVLARMAVFRARSFIELERHLNRVDWTRFIGGGAGVELRVSSRKSKLYHEGAIAQRFERIIGEAVGAVVEAASAGPEEQDSEVISESEEARKQLLVVRFYRDECIVSADSSGELLHRRGYRLAVAKAPLRETLAASMLLAAGWDGAAFLLDPFCGSGTIPIEAALLARRIPPALANPSLSARSFAFEAWPEFDPTRWESLIAEAVSNIRSSSPGAIQGSDRDEGAIEAALANARRAGVQGDIEFEVRPLSSVTPSGGPGCLVTNPPYGARVGEGQQLRNLYAALGNLARARLAGWKIVMLSAEEAMDRQTGLNFEELYRTRNGGIPVRLIRAEVPGHADVPPFRRGAFRI
jgi:putative N6-adenine-specific DNA methylase